MNLASIAQLPEPKYGNPAIFRNNIERFKSRYPVLFYSFYDWGPGIIKLKGNPDQLRGSLFRDGSVNPFAVNNLVYLTGMLIAQRHGLSHVIYLEEDCRVGCDYWDERIFEEYFNLGRPTIAAGTLACYNPCNCSPLAAKRWHELVASNTRRNFPVATYGWLPAAKQGASCVFPNGALGVYDVAWIDRLFPLNRSMELAAITSAWDMQLGVKVWEMFGEESYDVLGFLDSIYSGFANNVTTEDERKAMLTRGDVVAVHQIKSPWQP
jgi:hypothetical protein